MLVNPLPPNLQSALATGISASIRVGNELGAGNALQAKRVFHMTIFVTCKYEGGGGVVGEGKLNSVHLQ